jgi:membrane-anchored mycosin MYCP
VIVRRLGAALAAAGLVAVGGPAPTALALPYPVVDPAALPPDGPPGPEQAMRQNGTCAFNGAMPGFDPAAVPPSQAMMNLPEAWRTSRGAGITVAVIDSGVTPQPRLPRLTGGGDYVASSDGLVDCDGHGTAVAGIIAGAPAADGFAGVAPDAAIVSVRQSSAQYSPANPSGGDVQQAKTAGSVATLARAVRHAADLPGVKVMNISITDCIPAYRNVDQAALGAALRYAAIDKDIVVVAAAGNTGEATCQLTPTAQPSGFTMAGPWVGVAAPGELIVSLGNAPNSGLVNGQPSNKEPLVAINGTSFAAAYVSGVAALVRAKFPNLSAHQILNRIVGSAHNAARAPSNLIGAGVIDPVAALTWDIPDGQQQPADMPVVRVEAPAPPPVEDPWPARIALIGGGVLLAAALITVALIGHRRDRNRV